MAESTNLPHPLSGEPLPSVTGALPEVNLEADFAPLKEVAGDAPAAPDEIDSYQRDSLHAEQAFNRAVEAAAGGDRETAVQEYLRAAKIAETAREWHLAAIALQRVGDFLERPPPPSDLERAFRLYRRAVAAYELCGLFPEARELAYRLLFVKMHRAGELGLPVVHRVELFLYWATAGFGFRPLRVIGTALLFIFLYGLVYWGIGGAVVPATGERATFWQALYFSGTTFVTLNFGDVIPAPYARAIAMSESFIGPFLMSFFVVVLAGRLAKA